MQTTKVGLVVCVILVIALAVSNVWFYTILNDEIQILHNEKNSFQSQVNTLHDEKNSLQLQVNTLQSQVNRYESMLSLQEKKSILWQHAISQGPGAQTLLTSFNCSCAGYLNVSVVSSASNCYVTVEFWFGNRLFSSRKTLGKAGVEYFSVLPTESITVYVGNTNWFNGATHVVSVDYYY